MHNHSFRFPHGGSRPAKKILPPPPPPRAPRSFLSRARVRYCRTPSTTFSSHQKEETTLPRPRPRTLLLLPQKIHAFWHHFLLVHRPRRSRALPRHPRRCRTRWRSHSSPPYPPAFPKTWKRGPFTNRRCLPFLFRYYHRLRLGRSLAGWVRRHRLCPTKTTRRTW